MRARALLVAVLAGLPLSLIPAAAAAGPVAETFPVQGLRTALGAAARDLPPQLGNGMLAYLEDRKTAPESLSAAYGGLDVFDPGAAPNERQIAEAARAIAANPRTGAEKLILLRVTLERIAPREHRSALRALDDAALLVARHVGPAQFARVQRSLQRTAAGLGMEQRDFDAVAARVAAAERGSASDEALVALSQTFGPKPGSGLQKAAARPDSALAFGVDAVARAALPALNGSHRDAAAAHSALVARLERETRAAAREGALTADGVRWLGVFARAAAPDMWESAGAYAERVKAHVADLGPRLVATRSPQDVERALTPAAPKGMFDDLVTALNDGVWALFAMMTALVSIFSPLAAVGPEGGVWTVALVSGLSSVALAGLMTLGRGSAEPARDLLGFAAYLAFADLLLGALAFGVFAGPLAGLLALGAGGAAFWMAGMPASFGGGLEDVERLFLGNIAAFAGVALGLAASPLVGALAGAALFGAGWLLQRLLHRRLGR